MIKLPILQAGLGSLRVARQKQIEGLMTRIERENRYPSCHKGCTHCCHHPVVISMLEALSLCRSLQQKGRWTHDLRESCKTHSEKTIGVSLEIWMLSSIPCPLLNIENGDCTVYSDRPFLCRSTFSEGDPEDCSPTRFSSKVKIIDRSKELQEFRSEAQQASKRLKLKNTLMPISTALLLAEQVLADEVTPEEADNRAMSQYVEAVKP